MGAGVTCGSCTALVSTASNGGKCDAYCQSFGHSCVNAAEEQNNDCEVKYVSSCDQAITDTSDMLCTCARASLQQQPKSTTPPRAPQSSTNCSDANQQCAGWAARGECSKNPAYMLASC